MNHQWGLRQSFIQEIFDIIQDIQKQGTTVLLIEQNANKALAIADRGYVLETGKIVYQEQEKNSQHQTKSESISRWLK